jgi:hypothetical protein
MAHVDLESARPAGAHDHALAPTEEASYRLSSAAGWAVSACAVHCVLMPFAGVLTLLPGAHVFTSPWVEWSLVALAATIGGVGLGISYGRVHRDTGPVLTFLAGLGVLVATHSLLESRPVPHAVGAVLGAGVILVAARMNHSKVHACESCHPHPHGAHPGERPA